VSVFSPGADEEVEITRIIFCNTTASAVTIRLFHDDGGATYDESTALLWDWSIPAGESWPWNSKVDMSDSSGNLAYRSSIANGVTITGYGSVTS
jgi:hypothetical protein